jgi:hypothetical protein
VPAIGQAERDQAQRDLAYWKAGAIVLAHRDKEEQLHQTCEALFGPGRYVGGVWLWVPA